MKKSLLLLVFFILVFSLFSCNEEPEIQKYTVTFDSNGGEDVESQEVAEGKFVLEPEDPEKEYCEFLGWYYKNKKYKFDTPVDSDITLKAKWKAIEYEIRFDTDGGSRVPPVKVDGGETVDAPDEPTKEKYTFLGWFLDGEEYDFSQPVGEDITLTAKWEEIVLEDDEIFSKMQSVLLLGQSNMVGVGDILTVDAISDDRIFMMREDKWIKMREPLHTNADQAGIGIGGSFSKAFVETFDCKLGLIPAAEGATSLEDWAVGGRLYNEAIRLAKIAQKDSEICAILWHQGEGNQNDTKYASKLNVILNQLINDLGLDAEKIVIVTGELYGTRGDKVHTAQLNLLGNYYTNYGVASSDGLTTEDVDVHFDAPSLRVFGYRYFDIFYNCITGKNYEFDDNPESYRTAPSRDKGEIATFDFEDMNLGKVYNGPCGNGKIFSTTSGTDSLTIKELTPGNKSLLISKGYINSTNEIEASSVVVLEAKFMLDKYSACEADLLMPYLLEGSMYMYQNIHMAANGDIYAMHTDSAKGNKIGTITRNTWTSIRIVMDLKYNVKDIYVNEELVVRAAKISIADTKDVILDTTRLVSFSSITDGGIFIDDYRCYLFADNIAPGK